MVDRQQFPDSIHLTVMPTNVTEIDHYVNDLRDAITFAKAHPNATGQGNAAMYGLMARIPFRGVVEKNVRKIFEEMREVAREDGADRVALTGGERAAANLVHECVIDLFREVGDRPDAHRSPPRP